MATLIEGQVYREPLLPVSPGRPYIGPKAQTHVDPVIHAYVKEEARRRSVPISVIWREIIETAATKRYRIKL